MKTLRFIGFALLAILLCLSACSKGEEDEPIAPTPKPEVNTPTITLDSSIQASGLSFDTSASEKSISFTTTSDWTLSIAETRSGTEWCKASPTSGGKGTANVKFTTTENIEPDDRSVAVTIKAGATSKTFTVTQKGKDALLVTTKKYELPKEGGEIEIEVKANVEYQMAISETAKGWITEATGRSLTTHKHILKIAPSEEGMKREGEIIFKSGDLIETVKVYQAGDPKIILSKNEFNVSDAGETISIDLQSNVEYGVQMPDVNWIKTEEASRAMSSHTLKYIIEANDTYDSREAEIIFFDKNSSLKDTLKITQVQKDAILLSKKEYNVEAVGETIEVVLNSNVDFEISIENDWIKQVETPASRSLVSHKLYLQIAENESEIERSSKINITDKSKQLTETIIINQYIYGKLKENEKVIIDKPTIEIPNEGGEYTIQIESPILVYLEPQNGTDLPESSITPNEYWSPSLYEGYDSSFFVDKEIGCESKLEGKTLYIKVSALQSKINKNKTIDLYDYWGNVVGSIELMQEGKTINIPVAEAPLLADNAQSAVASIALNIAKALSNYNVIEQFYNYNKTTGSVNQYVTPTDNTLNSIWSQIYRANTTLLSLKKTDEGMLNVYSDYCNLLSALYYSNLVYGWNGVPYITDYDMIQEAMNGMPRESSQNIFKDIKANLLKAIENLPEKKNESLNGINGFFFTSKDVARVLLANIYMYEGNYTEAKPLLKKVIDNGYYALDAATKYNPSDYVELGGNSNSLNITESTEIIFALEYSRGGDGRSQNDIIILAPTVIPYITLSDVYLSLAECHYKLEDTSSAEQCIQKVIDAKSLNVLETNSLMKIKEVREQILLYSGTYFAFLKRTGLAKDVCGIEDYQLLFPIPNNEVMFNGSITQNPGY